MTLYWLLHLDSTNSLLVHNKTNHQKTNCKDTELSSHNIHDILILICPHCQTLDFMKIEEEIQGNDSFN